MNLESLRHQSSGRIPTCRRAGARRLTNWSSRLGGIAVTAAVMAACSSTQASNSGHPPSGSPAVSTSTSMTASHALFAARYPAPSTVISVDLHTGAKTTIPVNGYPRYSRPDGHSILVSTDSADMVPETLHRLDLAGNEQFTYPTEQPPGGGQFNGDFLQSADGAQLVLGTTVYRLVVIGNDGKHIRELPSPMSKAQCSPCGGGRLR